MKSDWYLRQQERRFAIYVGSKLHGETCDKAQSDHVVGLLKTGGKKDIDVLVLTANQETPATFVRGVY